MGAGDAAPAATLSPLVPDMVFVPGGTFEMGRRDDGDDALGRPNELPRHPVRLDAFSIGKYEVTNRQFVTVLNWALQQGCLPDSHGGVAKAADRLLIDNVNPACGIRYDKTNFITRPYGAYPSDDFPVVFVSWYGAVLFCNWLSQMQGLDPCYDANTWERIEPLPGGYRLPTEAEWERAAAWDPSAAPSHHIYGFTSDTLTPAFANYRAFRNETGPCPTNFYLSMEPRLSPCGFYDGAHTPFTAVSPAGCYDMTGNVWEWCHDRYDAAYYAHSPESNPAGPTLGEKRCERGGGWNSAECYARTAFRNWDDPGFVQHDLGFRVARSAPR